MNKLFLITGPAGVGKTTTSKRLAYAMEKTALIEGDDIYQIVKASHISPWLEGNHLELTWKNIIILIRNYLKAGYDVIFNYIIRQDKLDQLLSEFNNYEIKFVVLMVDKKTLLQRDSQRAYPMGKRAVELLDQFTNQKFDEKNVLNTNDLTIEDVVKLVKDDRRFIK